MATTDQTERAKAVASIRAVADFYDAHSEIPLPCSLDTIRHIREADEFAAAAEALGDEAVLEVSEHYVTVTLRVAPLANVGIQTTVHDLLGLPPVTLDRTDQVRRALGKLNDA